MNVRDSSLTEFDTFARFVVWTHSVLSDVEACSRLWPNHLDTDHEDTTLSTALIKKPYHYIHHRYSVMFWQCFLAFIKSTPTCRSDIVHALIKEWKAQKGDTVHDYGEVMAYLMGEDGPGVIANNGALVKYLEQTNEERSKMIARAMERYWDSLSSSSFVSLRK